MGIKIVSSELFFLCVLLCCYSSKSTELTVHGEIKVGTELVLKCTKIAHQDLRWFKGELYLSVCDDSRCSPRSNGGSKFILVGGDIGSNNIIANLSMEDNNVVWKCENDGKTSSYQIKFDSDDDNKGTNTGQQLGTLVIGLIFYFLF